MRVEAFLLAALAVIAKNGGKVPEKLVRAVGPLQDADVPKEEHGEVNYEAILDATVKRAMYGNPDRK